MGVLLALSFAFERGAKVDERFDLGLGEGGGGGKAIAAVASLDELDGDGRGFHRSGGDLSRRSAVVIWLSSSSRPWDFMTR